MNKVWLVAGVVLLCVVLLGAWFFVVDLGGFSQFLGKKTKQVIQDEPLRFVGTWNAPGYGTITFFATQTYRKGVEEEAWKLRNETLLLYEFDQSQPSVLYHYSFSENDTQLQLTDISNAEHIIFMRQ